MQGSSDPPTRRVRRVLPTSQRISGIYNVPVQRSSKQDQYLCAKLRIYPGASCDQSEFAPPGNERTNRGDVFYSKAVRARISNHGHNGIFVSQGNAYPRKISTDEAVGADSGVQLLRGSERLGVCQPTYLSVNTDNSTREQAASWAESKVGKGYESNFAATRIGNIDRDAYNCSQLIWAAYKHASGGGLDIGERYPYEPYQPAVYPLGILLSHNTTAFN